MTEEQKNDLIAIFESNIRDAEEFIKDKGFDPEDEIGPIYETDDTDIHWEYGYKRGMEDAIKEIKKII